MERACNEQVIKNFMDLLSSPLFKVSFFEFYTKMQQEGIDAAKRFWSLNPNANAMLPGPDVYEKLVDFYIVLGFVPSHKYHSALRENEKLREENRILKETINDFQHNIVKEGSETVQQAWKSSVDRQLDMNREVAKNFFEFYKYMLDAGAGIGAPKCSNGKQQQA